MIAWLYLSVSPGREPLLDNVSWRNMRDMIVRILVIFLTCVRCQVVKDAREHVFRDFVVEVKDIDCKKNSYIHTAMIMTNILGKSVDVNFTKESYYEGEKPKMIVTLQKMLQSLLKYSSGTPVHFIVFTDEGSRSYITKTFKDEIGRYLSETVIRNHFVSVANRVYKIPKLRVEYVSLAAVADKYRDDITVMKKHYGHHYPEGTVILPEDGKGPAMVPNFKYTLDLFYIVPFYHREFPKEIEKLVVIDIDLEFK